MLMEQISNILREEYADFSREAPAKRGRISPSKVSQGCLLAVYFDLVQAEHVEEVRKYNDVMTLQIGKFLHERLQDFFAQHYSNIGWTYMPEVKITISEHCYGSIDALVMDTEGNLYLDEYKTCSDSVFDALSKTPNEVYTDQVQLYETTVEVVHGRLLYLCRNNFKMREYVVAPDVERQAVLLDRVKLVEDAVVSGIAPAPFHHWMGTSPCTKVCIYRNICPETKKLSRRM